MSIGSEDMAEEIMPYLRLYESTPPFGRTLRSISNPDIEPLAVAVLAISPSIISPWPLIRLPF